MAISSFAAEDVSIPNIEDGRSLPLPGVLHKAGGAGPFPAFVMLVGCGGYAGGGPNADHQSSWAKKLVEWGYVALQVDSYSPRGVDALRVGRETNYVLVRVTNGRLDAPRLVTSRQVQREDIA